MRPEHSLIENFSNSTYCREEWACDYRNRYGKVLEASNIMIKRMNAYADDIMLLSTPEEILKILANIEQGTKRSSGWVGRIVSHSVNNLPVGIRNFMARASFQVFADNLTKIAAIAHGVQQYDKGPALTEGVDLELLQNA